MSKTIVEIESLRHGQTGPYQDSFYEANISVFVEGLLTTGAGFYQTLTKNRVCDIAKLFVHRFESEPAGWFSPTLIRCEPIGPTQAMIDRCDHPKWQPEHDTRWNVVIRRSYDD